MIAKNAYPVLLVGGLGLVVGMLSLVADQPLLGLVAGLLAAVAAAVGILSGSPAEQNEQNDRANEPSSTGDESDRAPTGATVSAGTPAANQATSREADASDGPRDDEDQQPTATGGGEPASATADAATPEPAALDPAHPSADDEAAALMDPSTGLFSEGFFQVALESRIAAARRHLRPVAMVLLEVVEGLPNNEPVAVDPLTVAATIKETLREADTACRLRNGFFAILLEDTPENGAIWTVERIRRQLAAINDGCTVWAGIACYPAHAFSPEEILQASELALVAAREWRQDRIEVAASAE